MQVFRFLDVLNEDPPYFQVIPKNKPHRINKNNSLESPKNVHISTMKSSQNVSPFASRPQQIQSPTFEPINEATIESNDKSEENDLKKIKKYSKILQTSTHLHKMYHTSSPSDHELQSLILQNQPQNLIGNQRLTFQIQNVFNNQTMKNQRKQRVLAKAMELGKSHFYRFLKEASIIGSNQHIHRFHSISKNPQAIYKSPSKTREISPNDQTLMVVSLDPNKSESPLQRKKKQLGLPKLLQRQTIKKKITLKTQMPLDHNLCLTTKGSSLSLKKMQSNKKQLIRNLTEINQKIRKNRKSHHEKEKLLFPNENLSMRNQQTFLSKWKYKSLFDSGQKTQEVRKIGNEKKHLATRMKTFTGTEMSRMSQFEGTILKGKGGFQGKIKFLKISRSKLLKKQLSQLSLSEEISLKNSKFGLQQ